MPQLTVTGGSGSPQPSPVTLTYSANDIAFQQAQQLASQITQRFSGTPATYYDPTNPPQVPASGYLIIPDSVSGSGSTIQARGFDAITVDNESGPVTVHGGANSNGQTVLAADGGLNFDTARGNTTVVAGGGDNMIDFSGGTLGQNVGTNAAYTSTGDDTIFGGYGNTTISAGGGDNKVYAMGGNTTILVSGTDDVFLKGGADTINVLAGGSAFVFAGNSYNANGYSLVFNGDTAAGGLASTIRGGTGSFSIQGGTGGGYFIGGSGGGNSIYGGSGSVTIFGGGANDTLIGGTGTNDIIRASLGNETLGGGDGSTIFQFWDHLKNQPAGSTDTIMNFTTQDFIRLLGQHKEAAINTALNSYTVAGGSGSFMLEDGTKVVLQGYTGTLTKADFK